MRPNADLLRRDEPPAQEPQEAPPAGAEIFFPKQRPKGIAYDSLARGRLVVDGEGCLRLRDGAGTTVPLWPPDYELDAGEDTRPASSIQTARRSPGSGKRRLWAAAV